jgi:hypothetical protein
MTKVVMTRSSGARSAKGRKPNGIINTKRDYAFFRKEFFNGIRQNKTIDVS